VILQTTGGFDPKAFSGELFPLGPWCIESEVSPGQSALELPSEDDLDIEATSSRLLSIIEAQAFPALNEIHGVNLSARVWKRSLGTYLKVLTPLVIIRYNLIRRAIRHMHCDTYTHVDIEQGPPVTNDRSELLVSLNSHAWNHALLSELCDSLGLKPSRPEVQTCIPSTDPLASRKLHPVRSGTIKKMVMSVCNHWAKRSKTLLTRTMLPSGLEFKLALRMRTLPYFWPEDISYSSDFNHRFRLQVLNSVSSPNSDDQILLRAILRRLPRVFVEDFARARTEAHLRLPRAPLRVFTSNLHQASDVFLLWLSEAQEHGTRITIAQHGGVHSLCRDVPPDIASEIELADRYISWGNRSFVGPNVSVGPTLVNVGRKPINSSAKRGSDQLLIVLDASYRYPSIPRGMNGSRFDYAHLINTLIQELDPNIVKSILVRPYRGSKIWDDSITDLLIADPRLRIDSSFPPIEMLYGESRMVVSTSLGTTFFQTIHHEVPTLILLDPTLSPLSEWAKQGLKPLENCSMLFYDSSSLAAQINRTYTSTTDWWANAAVRDGVKAFRQEMSPECTSPVDFYSTIVMNSVDA
jgi:putative transferase (TIGR04331 family)